MASSKIKLLKGLGELGDKSERTEVEWKEGGKEERKELRDRKDIRKSEG